MACSIDLAIFLKVQCVKWLVFVTKLVTRLFFIQLVIKPKYTTSSGLSVYLYYNLLGVKPVESPCSTFIQYRYCRMPHLCLKSMDMPLLQTNAIILLLDLYLDIYTVSGLKWIHTVSFTYNSFSMQSINCYSLHK